MLQISDLTDIQPASDVEEALIGLDLADELDSDARVLLGKVKSSDELRHCLEQFIDAAELRKRGLLKLTAYAFDGSLNNSNGHGTKDGSD